MPQLERWDSLPAGVRQHLIERMRDRAISISDLVAPRLPTTLEVLSCLLLDTRDSHPQFATDLLEDKRTCYSEAWSVEGRHDPGPHPQHHPDSFRRGAGAPSPTGGAVLAHRA